jgi:hypothetical protein
MSQQRRAVAAAEVDVLLAIQIPNAAALRAVEEHGMANRLIDTSGGRNAAGEVLLGEVMLVGYAGH